MFLKYGSLSGKYFYPKTNVLVNKLEIREENLLKEAELLLTSQRLTELQAHPLPGNFDLAHLREIHRYIFQDLYEFAGKIREVNISKGNFLFASAQHIVPNANKLFTDLAKENLLMGLDLDSFSKRSAHYMAELNVIHPFSEGNGRAIREFIRALALLKSHYVIKWDAVSGEELLKASIKSVHDISDLAICIKKCIL